MPLTCAHLVGSLPYPDADAAFTEIGGRLGRHLRRIPDGETGERARWIFWQRAKVAAHPAMEVAADEDKARIHQWDGKLIREWELFRFRAGVDPATVEFDPGYAPEAAASYARFTAMREAGTLPAGVRFQVCLPTPMAVGYWFVSPSCRRSSSRPTSAPSRSISQGSAPRFRTTTWRSSGTSARRCSPGRAISRTGRLATSRTSLACWPVSATPCRSPWSSATTSATARRTTSMW